MITMQVTFPTMDYIELNNYDIDGRGLAEVIPVNIGFGYLQVPTVTVSEPDLVDGTPPVVEASDCRWACNWI